MSESMLAGRLNYTTGAFEVKEIPVPEPAAGEVRVKVEAAGVCLSDVHLIEGALRPPLMEKTGNYEVTLGHEVAGTVEALGEGVEGVTVGDRVIVGALKVVDGDLLTLGVDYDGGWAEFVTTPVETLVPMPDDLPFEQAAIIPDAVSTPWAAVRATADVRAGESVGLWGVGGLGVHAVQLLRFVGATPLIAIDPSEAARERALKFGADAALDPNDEKFAEKLLEANGGQPLDVAFDFAGFEPVRKQAFASLRPRGRLIIVGITGGPLTIENDLVFAYSQQRVIGHYGSEPHHVSDLVQYVEKGRLDFSGSISGTFPLKDAAKAVEALESKKSNPIRLVLIP